MMRLEHGLRAGEMEIPVSKSWLHRILVADFLSERFSFADASPDDCTDVLATKRCLAALAAARAAGDRQVEMCCGDSAATQRFLAPVAAALGMRARWVRQGRLSDRPGIDYDELGSGTHELAGGVSSQFVSGLLFALPLLAGDSEIRIAGSLVSRGYVDMTLDVLSLYGIAVYEVDSGFRIPGGQRYVPPANPPEIEADWSGAAFPLAMAALGNKVSLSAKSRSSLSSASRQPDRSIVRLLDTLGGSGRLSLAVDGVPDLFPALAVVAACREGDTEFTGVGRLRQKESDRIAAMSDVLSRFGVRADEKNDAFVVHGRRRPFRGGSFSSFSDHRVAMAIAVGATLADSAVEIDDVDCVAKSFPRFFRQFSRLAVRHGAFMV